MHIVWRISIRSLRDSVRFIPGQLRSRFPCWLVNVVTLSQLVQLLCDI
jgi:hypothetical protein